VAAAALIEASVAPLAVEDLKRKLAGTDPHRVLRVLATAPVPPREKAVLQVLWCHSLWGMGETHPSLREEDVIAEACVSRATFYRARDQLAAWGLVEVLPAARNRSCVYVFPWRLASQPEADGVSDCDPMRLRMGSQIETPTEQPLLCEQERPPHDLPPPTDRREEEDKSPHAHDGPGTAALLALGMGRDEAHEWARRHPPETLAEAAALTRERATIDGARYARKVLTNWLSVDSPGTRARRESAPAREARETFAERERIDRDHWRDLRARFDALPDNDRARLIDAARAAVPLLRDRPADSPAVLAAAVNQLGAAGHTVPPDPAHPAASGQNGGT
jgi:hypothetical protein